VCPKIRFSQNRKAALKQRLLGVVASEGKRFPSIFAAAGDKINAAAYKEL
jgi:protein involved in ribonucleotide reduction